MSSVHTTSPNPQTATAARNLKRAYTKQFGQKCEDCEDDAFGRRVRCSVCHYLLCSFCYGCHKKDNDDLPGGCFMHMWSKRKGRA